jgi:hypothetical protein
MTIQEKILYHQIHPLKLLTDISTSIASTYFLWEHNLFCFFILFLPPSLLITILLLKYANLEKQKNTHMGKYILKYMSPGIQMVRLFGQVVVWVAAWFQAPSFIAVGVMIILLAWGEGLMSKRYAKAPVRALLHK